MTDQPLTDLEACMLHVASTLERSLTVAALHAIQSGSDGVLTVRDAIAAANRAGLQAGFGARKLAGFDAALAPAILLLEGDRAVVYHGRSPAGDLLIYDPAIGDGVGELAESQLRDSYTGYALLFRR